MSLYPFVLGHRQLADLGEAYHANGFVTVDAPALQADLFGALLAESAVQRRQAYWPDWLADADGTVRKNATRGYLGRVARAFLTSPGVLALMAAVTESQMLPNPDGSCYTYYDAGSFLGRHIDKPRECFATMLLCLESVWPQGQPPPPGNHLVLHRTADGGPGTEQVLTLANRAVILNGRTIPHERPVLGPAQRVVLLAGCYGEAT
jgi:hypothetical protein